MNYTQEDLDNGILRVDMDRYNSDEAFRVEIGKIFSPNKLRVWMVEYDDEGTPSSYTSLSYLATVQKMLNRGMIITTKQEYTRVKDFLQAKLKQKDDVPESEKEKFKQLLDAYVYQLEGEAKNKGEHDRPVSR